jgi:hypothetical protein
LARIFTRVALFALLPIAALLLGITAWQVSDTRAWLARSVEAPGTVIDVARLRDQEHGYMFAPLVSFQTRDGETIEFQSSLRSSSPSYRKGERVTVLYDPERPNSAAISSLASIWLGPMVTGIIGTAFLLMGIVFTLVGRRLKKWEAERDTQSAQLRASIESRMA